jgi:hypothetical protein
MSHPPSPQPTRLRSRPLALTTMVGFVSALIVTLAVVAEEDL